MFNTESITYDEFLSDLCEWATHWVTRVSLPAVKHAEELYEDKFLVAVLHEWATTERRHHERQLHVFTEIASGSCLYDESDATDEYDADRAFAYNEILYKHLGSH